MLFYIRHLFFSLSFSPLLPPSSHPHLSAGQWSSHCAPRLVSRLMVMRHRPECTRVQVVCVCVYDTERRRKLPQTRSINSSNGFDPLRLTAAINIKASLPCLPTSRTTSHGGGQACVCASESTNTHTHAHTQTAVDVKK